MHRLLRESRDRGNVLATLHASETSIYRRFGFGLATDAVAATITTRHAKPWRSAPLAGSMRLLPYTEVLAVVPDLYERVARWRVGSISRPAWMWTRILKDAAQPTAEPYGKGTFVAVHSDADGVDDGFVCYEVAWDETFAKNPTGVGEVHDLWGVSPGGRDRTVALSARHRPDRLVEGRATPGRRTGPPGDARRSCVRSRPAPRRPVGPDPRRRRCVGWANLRSQRAAG